MLEKDRKRIREILRSDSDFEIIREESGYIEFFDNNRESLFRACLNSPSSQALDSIVHVLPAAMRKMPSRELVIDFLLHLDPAMLAGIGGIYVRGGKDDDLRILEMSGGSDANVCEWHSEYEDRSGWKWDEMNSVVINMENIDENVKKIAAEFYPGSNLLAKREKERDAIIFEQFFITLGHEIRHAALDFPLTREYLEIYNEIERDNTLLEMMNISDMDKLEKDAETWAVRVYEKWLNSPTYGELVREAPDESQSASFNLST